MAYATVQELTNAMLPKAPPANAQQLLDRASRDVDQALLTAVYDPALPANVAALKLATLEQVQAGLDAGDRTGTGVQRGGGFTLGRLSVQAASSAATGAPRKVGRLWEQAWAVLQQAKLTGQGPRQPNAPTRTWP
ncbi:hypothetical protein ACQEVZ_20265 [Dactylosporangium sp. CA-152071]|uniref:hypothetical protein n=1 Tax=Dactylosporangium sp. CA-152071 TaxID=3239933 RepID=UPI003D8F6C5A